jgi:hypothetical protein
MKKQTMKTVSTGVMGIFVTSMLLAQVSTTVPVTDVRPVNAATDTVPPVNPAFSDTGASRIAVDTLMGQQLRDSKTAGWNKDSLLPGQTNVGVLLDTAGDQRRDYAFDNKPVNNATVPDTTNQKNDRSQAGTAKADTTIAKLNDKLSDRVMMKDGEMLVVKNGESTKLTDDIELPSGQVVTADGTVKKKDGTSVKLKDGQYIELKFAPAKKDAAATKRNTPKKKQ